MLRKEASSQVRLRPLALAVGLVVTSLACGALAQQGATGTEAAVPRPQEDRVRLGVVEVVGQGDRLGAGQIVEEDATKGRSTVTKEAMEKDRATTNPFQALTLLPGINTYDYDGTGLFGGAIFVRGFSGEQIGFTINGVPVNDSGNYALYPQEYVDHENNCLLSVTQGAPDLDSPHIGATGGAIGMTTCSPLDRQRIRFAQSLGQRDLTRTFVRFDSGRFAGNQGKVFLSYSHTEVDKWKGLGGAKRDHVDAAFAWDPTPKAKLVGVINWNKAVNHNILTMSRAQLAANGYFWDFSPTFVGHLPPVNGTAQRETSQFPAFYKLSQNPFENLIASVSGAFELSDNLRLKVQPYYWYGFGTGGTQQRVIAENAFLDRTTLRVNAARDLNGDRDTLDSIIVAGSNVTKTHRPGVSAELIYTAGAHTLRFGAWYERAWHRQTGPIVPVDNEGNAFDIWLRRGQITRPDGTPYQLRDWKTISPAYQVYLSDTIAFDGDRGQALLGVRLPRIDRNFTNYPSEGTNSQVAYTIKRSYDDVLPQAGLRYQLTREQQLFASVAKNFRAPPNFAFAPTNNLVQVVNGVPTLRGSIAAETAWVSELGYRYQDRLLTASATAFYIDFKNRQANAYDPNIDRSVYTNAGGVRNRGVEFELGTKAREGFSAYLSLTAQKSQIKNNLRLSATGTLPTAGKEFTLTPRLMAGLALQYQSGPWYARLKVKHTGKQYATLMNDEEVPKYTVADFDAGYRFGDFHFVRNLTLRVNVSNLGNTKYRNPTSNGVTHAVAVGGVSPSTVFYYLGAPRMVSASITADF
ncbi:MAG: TonB-dependent receptor [Casimicrobiaceae bacterium]|nr:TonB-dependent receptor [Casimicrobiaceae bacterium]MDW8311960.1 TonB-dependent receptor [Burkholderiales bacterium]